MTHMKRPSGRRFVAVALSCTALAAVSLGTAFAARNQSSGAVAGNGGLDQSPKLRLLVAEIAGPDDQDQAEAPEVETPEPADTPEAAETPEPKETPEAAATPKAPKAPETEPAETEQDDQGEDADDQGENEQGDAHDGAVSQHDSGDSGDHESGDSGDSGGD